MSRARHLFNKFGITEADYDALLSKQQGCCAVCGRHHTAFRKRLAVDHDHRTLEIRGLLCIHCNRYVVGRHRKENGAELLRAAYAYLTNEYPGLIVPVKKKKRRKKRVRIQPRSALRRSRNADPVSPPRGLRITNVRDCPTRSL